MAGPLCGERVRGVSVGVGPEVGTGTDREEGWGMDRQTLKPLTVSPEWLRQQAQRDNRVEYHGPTITWPIDKAAGETSVAVALGYDDPAIPRQS